MSHLEEHAELYALGMLDDVEAARARRHTEECEECRKRLIDAQNVVTQIAQASPQIEPDASLRTRLLISAGSAGRRTSRAWAWFAGGTAAGILAASLVLVPGRFDHARLTERNDIAFSTIVASHFLHVPFTGLERSAPAGKMLYGKHAEWLYIIVHAPTKTMEVQLVGPNGTRIAGELSADGANATLFIANPGRFRVVELTVEGKPIARATPVLTQ